MSDQIYCNFRDVLADLEAPGFSNEEKAINTIRAASEWIERRFGYFIPVTETKRFDGSGKANVFIEPLLSSSPTVIHDGSTLSSSQFLLYPRDRHWKNGPYTRISTDPDGSLSKFYLEKDVLSIAGLWGLYEESESTGATVQDNPLAVGGATLLVDDASLVSIGDLLLIESEQVLVKGLSGTGTDCLKNTNGAIDADDTTITIEAASGLNPGELLRIENEKMLLLDLIGDTSAIVERGYSGTLRASHTTGKDIFVYRTFSIKRGANGTTAAEHDQDVAISRYLPPSLVRYLARQIAFLMIRKADSGFAGKVKSIEAEEIFYFDEFPKKVYEDIKRAYRC